MRVNIFISGGFLIATLIRIVLCVSILDLFPDYIILPIIGLIHLILINISVPMNNSRLLHDLCGIGELVCHIFSFLSTESSDALEKSFSFLRVRQNARLLTTLWKFSCSHLANNRIHLSIRYHGEFQGIFLRHVAILLYMRFTVLRHITHLNSWETIVRSAIVSLRKILWTESRCGLPLVLWHELRIPWFIRFILINKLSSARHKLRLNDSIIGQDLRIIILLPILSLIIISSMPGWVYMWF